MKTAPHTSRDGLRTYFLPCPNCRTQDSVQQTVEKEMTPICILMAVGAFLLIIFGLFTLAFVVGIIPLIGGWLLLRVAWASRKTSTKRVCANCGWVQAM